MRLKAFGPFADAIQVSFDRVFDGGLFLIHGRTGAGKTSLLDGLCFSLFGRPSSEEREKDLRGLRSDLATPETMTETELIFVIGSVAYRVHRIPTQVTPKKRGEGFTEHKGSAELFRLEGSVDELRAAITRHFSEAEWAAVLGLTWTPLAGKVEAVDEAIEKLVGMNERQFRQVVVLPQGRFREFLSSTSTERQAILEKLFQTDRFSRLQQYIGARARTGEAELRAASQTLQNKLATFGLNSPDDIAVKKEQLIAEQTKNKAELEITRVKAEALGQELNRAKEFEIAKQRHDALSKEANLLASGRDEIENLKKQILANRTWAPHFQLEEYNVALSQKHDTLIRTKADALRALERLQTENAETSQKYEVELAKTPSLEQMTTERAGLRERAIRLKEISAAAAALELSKKAMDSSRAAIEGLKTKAASLQSHQIGLLQNLFAIDERLRFEETRKVETENRRIQELELQFHHSEAARLAESLSPGSPCPVCGSQTHPRPAVPGAIDGVRPDANRLQKERAAFETLRLESAERSARRHSRLEPFLTSVRSSEAVADPAGDFAAAFAAFDQSLASLRENLQQTAVQEAELNARNEAIALQREDLDKKIAVIPTGERSLENVMKLGLELKAQQDAREAAIKRLETEVQNAKAALARTMGTIAQLEDETRRTAMEHAEGLQKADALKIQLEPKTARPSTRLHDQQLAKYENDVEAFATREAKNAAALSEVDQTLARSKATRASAVIADEFASATSARSELERQTARTAVEIEGISKLETEATEGYARLSLLKAEAERASRMNALLTGDKSQNKMLVPLSRFVLQSRFEEVLEQANRRLGRMSRGQFQLRRPALSRNLRDSQGLELSVEDSVAGKERHAGSLSGGESFMAALSLALGLADVVQADLGGVKLDSVLIDEGFGTLDSESLDLAMKTLVDLQAGGRLVGIISHVQELKSQVHHQLEVIKAVRGSHVRWNVSN